METKILKNYRCIKIKCMIKFLWTIKSTTNGLEKAMWVLPPPYELFLIPFYNDCELIKNNYLW